MKSTPDKWHSITAVTTIRMNHELVFLWPIFSLIRRMVSISDFSTKILANFSRTNSWQSWEGSSDPERLKKLTRGWNSGVGNVVGSGVSGPRVGSRTCSSLWVWRGFFNSVRIFSASKHLVKTICTPADRTCRQCRYVSSLRTDTDMSRDSANRRCKVCVRLSGIDRSASIPGTWGKQVSP